MIERARQKNGAPIAKRISGDGAFCLFNSFIFGEIYLAECAIRSREAATTCIIWHILRSFA